MVTGQSVVSFFVCVECEGANGYVDEGDEDVERKDAVFYH